MAKDEDRPLTQDEIDEMLGFKKGKEGVTDEKDPIMRDLETLEKGLDRSRQPPSNNTAGRTTRPRRELPGVLLSDVGFSSGDRVVILGKGDYLGKGSLGYKPMEELPAGDYALILFNLRAGRIYDSINSSFRNLVGILSGSEHRSLARNEQSLLVVRVGLKDDETDGGYRVFRSKAKSKGPIPFYEHRPVFEVSKGDAALVERLEHAVRDYLTEGPRIRGYLPTIFVQGELKSPLQTALNNLNLEASCEINLGSYPKEEKRY